LYFISDPNHIIVSGHALAATAVGKTSFFTLSNVIGSLEDIEIAIDAPTGDSVPAQVTEVSKGTYKVEFCPSVAGEHQIYVSFGSEPVPGSPFPCKVYNVAAIQVRECKKGIVGKPVTFLVETSQAGPGNLEVTGKLGPSNNFSLGLLTKAMRDVEFSSGGYKIRKSFAQKIKIPKINY
jgi:filamin